MRSEKPRPTIDELFELLKRTSLPTVLVEGKDDILFYRVVEENLRANNVDMLPAGNKDAVLELRRRLSAVKVSAKVIFVVDKDLWVHSQPEEAVCPDGVITTEGYSVENDLFCDGHLEELLYADELEIFQADLFRFLRWYALSVTRTLAGKEATFRTHPNKLLDNDELYADQTELDGNEEYPEELFESLRENYPLHLRGKSLLAIMQRRLSAKGRAVKFSTKQLIVIGATRKGPCFRRLNDLIKAALEQV